MTEKKGPRRLPKMMVVDCECQVCGEVFEEWIEWEEETTECPHCSSLVEATIRGRGVHAHNRSAAGSASSWTVK